MEGFRYCPALAQRARENMYINHVCGNLQSRIESGSVQVCAEGAVKCCDTRVLQTHALKYGFQHPGSKPCSSS